MAVDLEYYGVPPADYRILENRTRLTAAAGQTTFPAPYVVGYVDVYFNGAKLDDATEFTATDGANVVLASAATLGDIVVVISRAQVQLTNTYTQQQVNALANNYYGICTGTGNAQTLITSPTFAAFSDGMVIRCRAVAANTSTTPTISVNGLTAVTITSNNGAGSLLGQDWVANSELTLRYNQALGTLVLVDGEFYAPGSLIGVKVITVAGNYTPSVGTRSIIVEAAAGGGAGGGAVVTSSNASTAGGGGSGGCAKFLLVSPPSTVAVTVGIAGAAVSGAAGGTGGSTTFGAYATLTGGSGGSTVGPSTAVPLAAAGGTGGTVTLSGVTQILQSPGTQGSWGIVWSVGGSALGGVGAPSLFGAGGKGGGQGSAGVSPGSGGGGSNNNTTGAALAGGAGAAGIIIVYEYA